MISYYLQIREYSRAFINAWAEREPSSASRFYEFVVYSLCDKLSHTWSAMMVAPSGDGVSHAVLSKFDDAGKQRDAVTSFKMMNALSFGQFPVAPAMTVAPLEGAK